MYFIHISSLSDAEEFTAWLTGKNQKVFADSSTFTEWLEAQKVFPLEIYLDGQTMRFKTQNELLFFRLGWEMALHLRIQNKND